LGVGELLKTKGEAVEALKRIIIMLERQSGKLLSKMRTDNGTEWVNRLIEAFCQRKGVIHQMAIPYSQEQNSLAERTITTYFKMVRCTVTRKGIATHIWKVATLDFLYHGTDSTLWLGIKSKPVDQM
jgi:transposase InsO family protein